MAQQVTNQTSIHEDVGLIPGLLSGLKIWYCHLLWCRSPSLLRSGVAVAVVEAGSCSFIQPLVWEPPYATGVAPKKKKKVQRSGARIGKETGVHGSVYLLKWKTNNSTFFGGVACPKHVEVPGPGIEPHHSSNRATAVTTLDP